MVSYGVAKARAMARKSNWNEKEYTSKATITWADSEYEYELEIENEDMDEDFEAWIEKHAEELAREDAEANGTTFEEVVGISYDYDYIDDDEAFDRNYEACAEFEWECRTGREPPQAPKGAEPKGSHLRPRCPCWVFLPRHNKLRNAENGGLWAILGQV